MPPQSTGSPWDHLTSRELVVLQQLLGGGTLEEIAAELFVSRNTVKSQVRSVYRKIGAGSREEAAAWADAAGLRDVPVPGRGR